MDNYLSILKRSFSTKVSDAEWKKVLSTSAMQNTRVSRFAPYSDIEYLQDEFSTEDSYVTNVQILDFIQLTGILKNVPVFKVTVKYTYNNPDAKKIWLKKIDYIKEYTLVTEKGQLVIDKEKTIEKRTNTDAPLVNLTFEEFYSLEQDWEKTNFYSYAEIVNVAREYIDPPLRSIYSMNEWGNLSKASPTAKKYYFDSLRHISENVKNNTNWKKLMDVKGGMHDPVFKVITAHSTNNHIRAIILGQFFPSLTIFEAELHKQDNYWIFTKLENIRIYEDLLKLKETEPVLYKTLTKMNSYRDLKINSRIIP